MGRAAPCSAHRWPLSTYLEQDCPLISTLPPQFGLEGANGGITLLLDLIVDGLIPFRLHQLGHLASSTTTKHPLNGYHSTSFRPCLSFIQTITLCITLDVAAFASEFT